MAGSIPITNTVTQGELPLATLLDIADTLLLYRDSALIDKDLRVTLQLLADFIRMGMAQLESPALTGNPTAPTLPDGDNTQNLATTAFVESAYQRLINLLSNKVDVSAIVDGLASNAADAPLSANQGRLLSEAISLKADLDSPTFTGVPSGPTPAEGDNSTAFATTEFVQQVATLLQLANTALTQRLDIAGQIKHWRPNTTYYTNGNINDVPFPANIVFYNGSLYLVLQDFTSEVDFSEKSGATLVLSRLSMDTDPDVLELYAGAMAPLWLNQELGGYLALRNFDIYRQHVVPHIVNGTLMQIHMAMCNGSITDTNVVTLRRTNVLDGTIDNVATITFNTTAGPAGMPGTIVFNDAASPDPTNRITVKRGDALSFVLTTKSVDLAWVRINMVGNFISYLSPTLDIAPM